MTEPRTSNVLGLLRQNERFADWYESAQFLATPFFGSQLLPVIYTDVPAGKAEAEAWISRADAALSRFLAMGALSRREATPLVLANYQRMLEATDNELLYMHSPDDIWRFVHPTGITITQDGDVRSESECTTGDFFVQVECECDWEEEHGLLLVFREGRMLTRVSPQDGHLTESHAYDQPEENDPLMRKYYATYGWPSQL